MSDRRPLVYFIGGGPGDLDLLTVKARRILEEADVILYTDSLVDPAIADLAKPGAEVHGSAPLHLEQILDIMVRAASQGKTVARVHSGDPSIFGAVLEQMVELEKRDILFEIVPGVSSVFAAAAAMGVELTVPELSQTLILTRAEGRTPMPPGESLRSLASHGATIVLFLSAAIIRKAVEELMEGGYKSDTPAAVVYRASWSDQQIVRGTLGDIADRVKRAGIRAQALIFVGRALDPALRSGKGDHRSRLYDKTFTHSFRKATVQ